MSCRASLACGLVRRVEKMTLLKAQPLHAITLHKHLRTPRAEQPRPPKDDGAKDCASPFRLRRTPSPLGTYPKTIRVHLLTSQSGISPPFLRALRCDVRADTAFAAVPTSPQCRKIARIIIWVSPAPGTCSAVPYYVISGLSRSLAASGSLGRRRCAAHAQIISIPNMPQGL